MNPAQWAREAISSSLGLRAALIHFEEQRLPDIITHPLKPMSPEHYAFCAELRKLLHASRPA